MATSNIVSNKRMQIDQKVWHSVTHFSANHSKLARFVAIPIFFGTVVRYTLISPLKCAENIIQLAKSIYQLVTCRDANRRWWYWNDVQINISYGILNLVATPLGPVVGIIDATATVFKFMKSPVKTAKINACKQDFEIFKKEKDYRDTYTYRNNVQENFVSSASIADAIFARFKRQVWSANTSEEVLQIPSFNGQNPLIDRVDLEIRAKTALFNEKREFFDNRVRANENNNNLPTAQKQNVYRTLLTGWQNYQTRIINADVEFQYVPNSDEVNITLKNLPVYR